MTFFHTPTTGFLRLQQVLALLPISKSSFYAGIKEGIYPAPVKLGKRTSAWRSEDIVRLIEQLGSQPSGFEGGE